MEFCKEIILDDIVDVAIYEQKDVSASLPSTISGLQSVTINSLGTPLAFLSIREDEDVDILLDSSPTLKVSSVRQGKGLTYNHDLSLNIILAHDKVQELIEKVKNTDIHIIYRRVDNSYCMTYGFPEATVLTHEENSGSNRSSVLKAQLPSLSALVSPTISIL